MQLQSKRPIIGNDPHRPAHDQALRAREVLDGVVLTEVISVIFDTAGRLVPESFRSLGAIHLVAALDLGDDLVGFVTCDSCLAEAAE